MTAEAFSEGSGRNCPSGEKAPSVASAWQWGLKFAP